jgi:hypothetical protein
MVISKNNVTEKIISEGFSNNKRNSDNSRLTVFCKKRYLSLQYTNIRV